MRRSGRFWRLRFSAGKRLRKRSLQPQKNVARGVAALKSVFKFGPYVAGDQLTYADTAAITVMPIAPMALQRVGGTDPFADWPQLQSYFSMMRQRPHVQKVEADSMAAFQAMMSGRG
jgi:glutathione S-transferase